MTALTAVEIVGIRFDPIAGTSAVVLGESERPTRVLPIMIGAAEAQSIAMSLAGVVPPRPGTHDLTTSLLSLAGSTVEEVVVTELVDGVFFAELFVEVSEGMKSISARPSDAIALAVRVGAPIFVRSNVLDEAGVAIEPGSTTELSDDEIDHVVEEFHRFLESAKPSDFEAEP